MKRLDNPPCPVLRPEERKVLELTAGTTWSRLTPTQEPGVMIVEVCKSPGEPDEAERYCHSGREWGLVLEGMLRLELGQDTYLLGPGDTFTFDSTTPHRACNPGSTPTRVIWVNFER